MAPTKKDNLVYVRSKKTGDIDIRRASEYSKRSSSSSKLQPGTLHYVGADRTRVCRCAKPKRHYESLIPVASESTHLNASLTKYMDCHALESCTMAQFQKFEAQRKASWAEDGVHIDDFHYVDAEKNVVCRCHKHDSHGRGIPRNPEIIERCAEFFRFNTDKKTCTKKQCRNVDGDVPKGYSPESQYEPSSYDLRSTYHFPQHQAAQADHSPVSPEIEKRSTTERMNPVDRNHPHSGPQSEPDFPEYVRENARTSARTPLRRDSEWTTFTPLVQSTGTAPLKFSRRASVATYWSNIQREAGVDDGGISPGTPKASRVDSPFNATAMQEGIHNIDNSFAALEKDDNRPSRAFSGHSSSMSVPFRYEDNELQDTPEAELSAQRAAAKLGTKRVHRHTATLRDLEGRDWDTASELTGKRSTIYVEKAASCTSIGTKVSVGLSSLFEQVHNIVRLPDQEELLLRHVIISSRTNPAPSGDCSVCSGSYQDRRKRTIMLPDCGHFLHMECLVTNFRIRDQQVGTCPICNLALCERTVADRIDTDHEAIFGSQFSQLRSEVRVEYPQRGRVVECGSEEEVAAAQLRLMKDYIDVHAEELFRLWEAKHAEPDWYLGVIRPVVKLFQGWNLSLQQSRFFADRKAFLNFVAWAELVRLMNITRANIKKAQGEDAPFPQLAELHRKFMWAKDRYDKEKKTWQTNRSGVLECEKVAQDAIELAMNTHSSR